MDALYPLPGRSASCRRLSVKYVNRSGKRQRSEKGYFRLPRSLNFDVFGLDESFAGDRVLGMWEQDRDTPGPPVQDAGHVYRVITDHFDYEAEVAITVHTVPRVRRPQGGWDYGFRDAAGSALLHSTWKADWCEPGACQGLDLLELLSLADDTQHPGWDRTTLTVKDTEIDAYFRQVGQAWTAAVELEDVALAVSGCRSEPNAYGLVPIAELTRYRSRPWPRQWERARLS